MNRFIPSRSWQHHEKRALAFEPRCFPLCLCGKSKSCLNARSEGAEVADALDFVIGKFDAEVIFEACEQFERLQAVDPKLLVEIIAGLESGARNFKMGSGQIQNFLGRLFDGFHDGSYPIAARRCEAMADKDALRYSR